MHETLQFLANYGHIVVFAFVLAEQLGAPVPSLPVLLAAGALAGDGQLDFGTGLAVALVACVMSDGVWYGLGRARGQRVLRLLCRLSLEPDSCVGDSRSWFKRLGTGALVIAKFVPGLSTIAPPMAGVTGMAWWKFGLADAAGSFFWAGSAMTVGYLFRRQLEAIADRAFLVGSRFAIALALLLALYIAWKYWQRRRFLKALRVARVTPEELRALIDSGEPVAIVDLRHVMEVRGGGERIPGAMWFDRATIAERQHEIPRDRDVILYCT